VTLQPNEDDQILFTESFLSAAVGICVFGQAPALAPGQLLSADEVTSVIEWDFDVELECLLLEPA
jgi:hypothetical protein